MIVFDRKNPKTSFQGYYCPKKEKKKMPFFDRYHRLTPSENMRKCK